MAADPSRRGAAFLHHRGGPIQVDIELGMEEVDLERWVRQYVAALLEEDARETGQGCDPRS